MMQFLPVSLAIVMSLCAAPLWAQDSDPFAKEEAALNKSAALKLVTFARVAERNKVFSRAKEAYELVVENYDPENLPALRAMEWTKSDGVWTPPREQKRWPDDSNDEKRFQVIGEWRRFAEAMARLHRELGKKMLQSVPARAVHHLQMALYYDPHDIEAHQALEHEEWEGFWGTPEEVAFVKRMRDIDMFAAGLMRKQFDIEPVLELPPELQVMVEEDGDIEFFGAKSPSFTIFTRGTQENANDCVLWAERACDYFEFMLPTARKGKIDPRKILRGHRKWIGFIWTNAEQKQFIRLNPQVGGTENFRNISWVQNGKLCEVVRSLTPVSMHDKLIATVFRVPGGNDATLEGFMHAATWLMRATAITRFGAIDTGTTTGSKITLPDSATWWMREMRDQATGKTDFPCNGIPRVQLANFNSDARIKTWSFNVWMLARYPEKWIEFLAAMPPAEKRPFPELIDEIYLKVFERSRVEIEDEWRGWAAGRTLAAEFTGYGPPLLPEKPNADQIKGLKRLNEFRALIGLPECEIDLESTMACRDHALFLQQNPEHWKWPEAHEEDPARPGFTTRGMRAGLHSVIVISPDGGHIDPADSLDGWLGTVYHRFPLLEPNIRRIGFAAEGNVVVLDMGSLEEPRTPDHENEFKWVAWPPDGMENIPVAFHGNEEPDPCADTPEGKAAAPLEVQRRAGYPVSLQFARHIATQLDEVSLTLYRCKKRGQTYERDEVVPCWVHTPKTPLLKRQENTSVVFAVPKEFLEPNTTYEAVAMLTLVGGQQEVKWQFSTGTQKRGHGRLKMPKKK